MSDTTWSARRRRRHPVAVLLAAVTVPALLMAAVWQLAERRAARGEPPAATAVIDTPGITLATPVISVRRIPTTVAVAGALGAFRFQLGAVSSTLTGSSCLAVGAHDREVLAVQADQALIPASNQKLLIAAVALDLIGGDATFVTEMRGDIVDGVATGPLHLVGGGDPLLAVASYPATQRYAPEPRTPIEELVERAVASGLVAGRDGIIVHDDRYDSERFVPSWGDGIRGTEAGPVGALLINDGFISGNPIKPQNPAVAAGIEVATLLRVAGVDIAGTVRPTDDAPDIEIPDQVLATVTSAPLRDVVAEMLLTSDNTTAEMLVKEIAVVAGRPGTRIDGLSVVQEHLDRWGLPLDGMTLVDASGLDRGNRLTCDLVRALLQRPGQSESLLDTMAVAGESGTMSGLLRDTPLAGRLRAKTGTLRGVKAFSGYLPGAGGVELSFSLMINGDETAACGSTTCPQLETLARALATYPGGAPTPAALRPLPVVIAGR
jgi:serine-type D-Ala-D-Ala carboxypeptidase/endopeptidase (penicillin-binding protein 4)